MTTTMTGLLARFTTGIEWACALGCGLIAGVFFGFSSFVMPALARLPASQGIQAMQSINRFALHRPFLSVFVGTAGLCVVLALLSLGGWAEPRIQRRLAGCLLYVVGTFVVTLAFNVPRNVALDALDPATAESAASWAKYVSEWTLWNHVRGAAALAALALIGLAR
jgi:uncharacterized membrane protein